MAALTALGCGGKDQDCGSRTWTRQAPGFVTRCAIVKTGLAGS